MSVKRSLIQWLSALMLNGNLKGFVTGKLYRGPLKKGCVPVLNCYSCPGAVGACPVGSCQASLGKLNFPFLVTGFITLIGIAAGRFFCGWVCPFGWIQELLNRIPSPKIKMPRPLLWGKYISLLIFVILIPLITGAVNGHGDPGFCKYLCPAGILEGAVPLLQFNPGLAAQLGWLFSWKTLLLSVVLVASVFLFRPFCKALCPLGAFYGLLNRISIVRLEIDETKCSSCGICEKTCPMDINPRESPGSPECIRCGQCAAACPTKAITLIPSKTSDVRPHGGPGSSGRR